VEFANANNQWPTDKLGVSPVSGQKGPGTPATTTGDTTRSNEMMKSTGLYNLGNSKNNIY
jgi:hypothetical protein